MTEPDHKPDGSGLDDGPWLPRCGPRKKPAQKTHEEMAAIRTKAWKTRRSRPDAYAGLIEAADRCEHQWVDARNEHVESGEVCPKCGAIRAGNKGGK